MVWPRHLSEIDRILFRPAALFQRRGFFISEKREVGIDGVALFEKGCNGLLA